MAGKYITKLYDRFDRICHDYYGTANNRVTERVIEANPGLEDHDIILPLGITVILPDLPRSILQDQVPVVQPNSYRLY